MARQGQALVQMPGQHREADGPVGLTWSTGWHHLRDTIRTSWRTSAEPSAQQKGGTPHEGTSGQHQQTDIMRCQEGRRWRGGRKGNTKEGREGDRQTDRQTCWVYPAELAVEPRCSVGTELEGSRRILSSSLSRKKG